MRRLAAVFTLSALLAGCGSSEVTFTAESPSANLAAIAISPGELDQIYQPQLERYTSTQGFPVTSVRVTPTGADERAVIRVNGTTVASGTQSAPIPIEVGLNDIAIEVTAADGNRSRAYSIEVTRQFEAQFAEEAYLKASNTGAGDRFGWNVALSGDTLAVGAPYEASAATGIGGEQADDGAAESGAVYVFVRDGESWTQQAYIKASNAGAGDRFGWSVALSGDTLAVGAYREDSAASGIDGDEADNLSPNSGAVYVYTRTGAEWTQQAYIKPPAVTPLPSQPGDFRSGNQFGWSVALSGDVLAVGAPFERSSATGIGGSQVNAAAPNSGAAYVYTRSGANWSAAPVYIKASNTGGGDQFGYSLVLDGTTLAVSAPYEDSASTGVGGEPLNNDAVNSGAVYVYVFDGALWTQQAYLKASNTAAFDNFGFALALSGDTLAVGAPYTDSAIAEEPADVDDPSSNGSGAAYVFLRDGSAWAQQAYLKSDDARAGDLFGYTLALSGDTLLVGAPQEDGGGSGPLADPANKTQQNSGAAYLFARDGDGWSQLIYVKSSNPDRFDWFGQGVALSGDLMVVAAPLEDGSADGGGTDNAVDAGGAVYILR